MKDSWYFMSKWSTAWLCGKKSAAISVTDYFKVNQRAYQIQEILNEMKFKFQQNASIKLINIKRKSVFLHVISIGELSNLRTGLH